MTRPPPAEAPNDRAQLSPRAQVLLLNAMLAAAGRGAHIEDTLGELRAYIIELESRRASTKEPAE